MTGEPCSNRRRRESILSERIAAGKADPISEEEREIVASIRTFFDRKYGKSDD